MRVQSGFTLVEVVIVVMIVGVLVIIAAPHWQALRRRSHTSACIANLRHLANAKAQFAIESPVPPDYVVVDDDLAPYLVRSIPFCPATLQPYDLGTINAPPTCPVVEHAIP